MAIKPGADAAALNVLISIHWFDFPALSGWFFLLFLWSPRKNLCGTNRWWHFFTWFFLACRSRKTLAFPAMTTTTGNVQQLNGSDRMTGTVGENLDGKWSKFVGAELVREMFKISTTFATSFHPQWIGQKLNQLNPKPMAAWDKVGLLKLAPSPWERLCQAGWWRRVCLGERRRRTVEWQEQFSPQVFFFFSVGSLFFLLLRFWLTFPGSLLFEFLGRKKRGIQEANFPNHKEKPLMKNVPFVGEGGGKLYTDNRREVTEW